MTRPRCQVVSLAPMQPLKAQVRNGRLLLDEPTDLPDGEVVFLQLQTAEAVEDDGDDLDEEERAALDRELDASFAAEEAGELIDADAAIADLRALR
jgi:hypothetical protein